MTDNKTIPVNLLECNTGQLKGLPKNPRLIKDERFKKLVKSIKNLPEMAELRPLLVYFMGKKYVIVGGNMRFAAMRELKWPEVPCVIIPEGTPVEKLKEIAIKDNNSFGEDNWELLNKEWNEAELVEWGVEIPGFDLHGHKLTTQFQLASGKKGELSQMTFTLTEEQSKEVKRAIVKIKETAEYKREEKKAKGNSNGLALHMIIKKWNLASKK